MDRSSPKTKPRRTSGGLLGRSLANGDDEEDISDDDQVMMGKVQTSPQLTSPQRNLEADHDSHHNWQSAATGVKKMGVLRKVFNLNVKSGNSSQQNLARGDWAKQALGSKEGAKVLHNSLEDSKETSALSSAQSGLESANSSGLKSVFKKPATSGKSGTSSQTGSTGVASIRAGENELSISILKDLHRQHEARIEALLEKHQQRIIEVLPSKFPSTGGGGVEYQSAKPQGTGSRGLAMLKTKGTPGANNSSPKIDESIADDYLAPRKPSVEKDSIQGQALHASGNPGVRESVGILKKATVTVDEEDDGTNKKSAAGDGRAVLFSPGEDDESEDSSEGDEAKPKRSSVTSVRSTVSDAQAASAANKRGVRSSFSSDTSASSTKDKTPTARNQTMVKRMSHVVARLNRALATDHLENAATKTLKELEKSESFQAVESGQVKPTFQQRIMLFCRGVVRTKRFDLCVALLIVSNAIVIGFQTEWSVGNEGATLPGHFRVLEIIYVFSFTLELLFRIGATGKRFIMGPEWRWNIFDSLVVFSAIGEELLLLQMDQGGESEATSQEFTLIRALAILRLVRITRVIRVMQFSRDLRIMVYGIANSLRSLMWAVVLLLLVMFILAVIVTQVITDSVVDGSITTEDRYEETDGMSSGLGHYSSLLRSAYSLYKAISGGEDWGLLAEPLINISPVLGLLFAMYIAFSVFCVLNVVTGVFVENTSKIKENDTDHMIMEELSERSRYLQEVRNLFVEIDSSDVGVIDWPEFEIRSTDLRVQAFFRKIGLNVESHNARRLFQLLDYDADGIIDAEDFVLGCAQLRGSAQKLDITSLRHDTRKISKSLQVLSNNQGKFESLANEWQEIAVALEQNKQDPTVAKEVAQTVNDLVQISNARWRQYEQYEKQSQNRLQENATQILQVLEPLSRLLGEKDTQQQVSLRESSIAALPAPPPADTSFSPCRSSAPPPPRRPQRPCRPWSLPPSQKRSGNGEAPEQALSRTLPSPKWRSERSEVNPASQTTPGFFPGHQRDTADTGGSHDHDSSPHHSHDSHDGSVPPSDRHRTFRPRRPPGVPPGVQSPFIQV